MRLLIGLSYPSDACCLNSSLPIESSTVLRTDASHHRQRQGRDLVGRALEIVAAGREFHHLLLRADETLARALVIERRDPSVGDNLAAGDIDVLHGAVGRM